MEKRELAKKKKEEKHKSEEEKKQETGFPKDVDFKRFLGCGG
ncbi:hypothetical protein [Ekhidna sp.]